jgi:hypothetical protein
MEFMTTLQGGYDEQKPSLFEILSENELSALIPPSIRYLLAIAAHRNPRYLLRILNNFDELYALLSLAIERYYLGTYGGGFTENFYGLKRERVLRIKGGETPRARLGAAHDVRETLKLRTGDIWRNLAVMVGIPYIKRKLDESYDIHAAGVNMLGPAYRDRDAYPREGGLRKKVMWYYKWFLRNVYPSVNAAYWFAMVAWNLAYLFDGTKFHSPFMMLIGSRMRRLNAADGRAIELATAPPPPPEGARPGLVSLLNPRTMGRVIYPQLLSSLRLLLPTSIFALKFLEWWHNSDFARQLSRKTNEGLELPPPIIAGPKPGTTSTPNNKANSVSSEDSSPSEKNQNPSRRDSGLAPSGPPISAITYLPILTVPFPPSTSNTEPSPFSSSENGENNTSSLCPICTSEIQTATAAQTGYVYCYSCIFRWVDGTHPRQETFMDGSGEHELAIGEDPEAQQGKGSRAGRWESGKGRDAVTGRRVLGGTSGLRRVMV